MFCPGAMTAGPVFVANRSADVAPVTSVVAVALLFSSLRSNVWLETVAILVKKVPDAVPAGIASVTEKLPLAPAARSGLSQLSGPPPPTAGVVQVHPAGADRLTKVIPAGTGSESKAATASSGPKLRTLML